MGTWWGYSIFELHLYITGGEKQKPPSLTLRDCHGPQTSQKTELKPLPIEPQNGKSLPTKTAREAFGRDLPPLFEVGGGCLTLSRA